MEIIIIALLIIGLSVYAISFFKKDRLADVENQMEHLSITLMQELYKVKKKQKYIEEEVMINENHDY